MKILLVHYAAPPVVGGVESVMVRHARLMAQHGHQVCIIAGRGGQMDERIGFRAVPEVDSRGLEVLALKRELDRGHVPTEFESLVDRIEAQLWPDLREADRVIAHNVCSLNKNLALTAALHRMSQRPEGPRFILWHHDLAWTTPRYRDELHDGYPWDLLRTDWPACAQVVVSELRRGELADLMQIPRDRIHVVPNGVEPGEFLKLETETQQLESKLHLSAAAPLILLPVRITPRKNIEMGLRVLARLRARFENVQLLVTGPLGPHNPANEAYLARLQDLRAALQLEGAAHFLADIVDHTLSDAVISDLFKLADLLILPSREEGFGIPILEAGLAGIPIFCSDISALRELGQSEVRYFSPDDDPEQVAGQIAAVLEESNTYALRKRVLRAYSWEQIYADKIAPLLARG